MKIEVIGKVSVIWNRNYKKLITKIEDSGIEVSEGGNSLIKKRILSGKHFKGKREMNLVAITFTDMGLPDGGTLSEVIRAASELGLKPLNSMSATIITQKLPPTTWNGIQWLFIEEKIDIDEGNSLGSFFQVQDKKLMAFHTNEEVVLGKKFRNFPNPDTKIVMTL